MMNARAINRCDGISPTCSKHAVGDGSLMRVRFPFGCDSRSEKIAPPTTFGALVNDLIARPLFGCSEKLYLAAVDTKTTQPCLHSDRSARLGQTDSCPEHQVSAPLQHIVWWVRGRYRSICQISGRATDSFDTLCVRPLSLHI